MADRTTPQAFSGDLDPHEVRRRTVRDSPVYFMASAGLVKIGRSLNPAARLASIRTMNASEVELLFLLPGGPDLESALHAHFAHHRHHGEWFDLPEGWEREARRICRSLLDELNWRQLGKRVAFMFSADQREAFLEAAEYLGCSENELIDHVRKGRVVTFAYPDVDEAMEEILGDPA